MLQPLLEIILGYSTNRALCFLQVTRHELQLSTQKRFWHRAAFDTCIPGGHWADLPDVHIWSWWPNYCKTGPKAPLFQGSSVGTNRLIAECWYFAYPPTQFVHILWTVVWPHCIHHACIIIGWNVMHKHPVGVVRMVGPPSSPLPLKFVCYYWIGWFAKRLSGHLKVKGKVWEPEMFIHPISSGTPNQAQRACCIFMLYKLSSLSSSSNLLWLTHKGGGGMFFLHEVPCSPLYYSHLEWSPLVATVFRG